MIDARSVSDGLWAILLNEREHMDRNNLMPIVVLSQDVAKALVKGLHGAYISDTCDTFAAYPVAICEGRGRFSIAGITRSSNRPIRSITSCAKGKTEQFRLCPALPLCRRLLERHREK